MKKAGILIAFIFLTLKVFAFPQLGISLDIGTAQDFIKKTSYQFNADFRVKLSDDFEARLPITFTTTSTDKMADAGAFICFYPFSKGLYFGISAVQFGYHDKSFIAMNEITAGWTFEVKNRFYVEPELCIRDPSGTYSDEYSDLRGIFPSYSTFRIRLKAGFRLFTQRSDEK